MVTGAAGSTGFAIAKALVEDGLRVLLVDIDAERLERLCNQLGEAAIPVPLDVSDPDRVAVVSAAIRADHGEVDILINNAGILSNNKAAETTPAEWRRLMAVNLDGAFYLAREWLPGMKARGWGRIVNMCSLAMKTGGLTAGTAYTASKGGMAALTLSLARESAAHGVTVNAIAPAYIKTPMITEQLSEAQREQLLLQIPVGRFCEPEEVAFLVCYLISPLAGFVTGEIVDINGGLHLD
ncbi:MAG: SDR family oxidoreductase [Kiloniellaceae bacterium]|nr:SDR family oxidoreductase [Kiloniellaceae bacterium]